MVRQSDEHGIERIVTGGQTGVDRGALDAAIALGIDHGGWCPAGRRAEDGPIPNRYLLVENASRRYADRTEQNVVDSDATLILHRGSLSGGTRLTRDLAVRHGKPCLVVDLGASDRCHDVLRWLRGHGVRALNIAGPRESARKGIAVEAESFLRRLLGP